MRHIKLILQYDGTNYAGWQSQTNATAIQDVVAGAIAKMVEMQVPLTGASRTDSGVHAWGQVASFQTGSTIPCKNFLKGLNALLPPDIRVVKCEEVSPDFHPILDAKSKTYRYFLDLGEVFSPFWRTKAWWVDYELNCEAMQEASRALVGEHDFKSFQGPLSNAKTTVREMTAIDFEKIALLETPLLCITFKGNGFLKYMIRNIVGTLVEVGRGKRDAKEMESIVLARNRSAAGATAPAEGLHLIKIEYSGSTF